MIKITFACIWFCFFISCAANTHISETIVFTEQEDQFKVIAGVTLATNYSTGAKKYAENKFGKDTLNSTEYPRLLLGPGASFGFLIKSFSMAISVQPLMIGTDATIKIVKNGYFSSYTTSNLSYGFSYLQKIDFDKAIGFFYRKDHFNGFKKSFPFPERDVRKDFYAGSYGIKVSLHSTEEFTEKLYFGGIGYSPTFKAMMLFVGIDNFKIF